MHRSIRFALAVSLFPALLACGGGGGGEAGTVSEAGGQVAELAQRIRDAAATVIVLTVVSTPSP